MKERPILFSAPMVRAILEGRKTQTRRVMKPQPEESFAVDYNADGSVKERRSYGYSWRKGTMWPHVDIFPGGESLFHQFCPYGRPGDRLYVKEAFRVVDLLDGRPPRDIPPNSPIWYLADAEKRFITNAGKQGRYRHARFMTRALSRITLEITGVRVERLQDISGKDAVAEGWPVAVNPFNYPDALLWYSVLWRDINGAESWAANPWVWVVEFKRIDAIAMRGAA